LYPLDDNLVLGDFQYIDNRSIQRLSPISYSVDT